MIKCNIRIKKINLNNNKMKTITIKHINMNPNKVKIN